MENSKASQLAKCYSGIKQSVDMTDSDEKYFNPKLKEYEAYVAGYTKHKQDVDSALNESHFLKILVEILNKSNTRKHLNINGFGYSQVERDIVTNILDEIKKLIK